MGNKTRALQRACIKTLSKSELCNQKEFNGVAALKPLFGEQNQSLMARFHIRGQDLSADVSVTWYNSRESHAYRNEYRLYYEPNLIMAEAAPGDNVVIGYDGNQVLNCILFKNGSIEHQGEIKDWKSYI